MPKEEKIQKMQRCQGGVTDKVWENTDTHSLKKKSFAEPGGGPGKTVIKKLPPESGEVCPDLRYCGGRGN